MWAQGAGLTQKHQRADTDERSNFRCLHRPWHPHRQPDPYRDHVPAVLAEPGIRPGLDLSELEITLEEEGRLQAFKDKYRDIFEKDWDVEKGKIALAVQQASRVMHELDPETCTTADSWRESAMKRADINPGDLAWRCLELMGRRHPDKNLVFVVDEVGQFVARDLISADPLPPGTVYTASVSGDGTVGLYRVEVTLSSGTSKLRPAGGIAGAMKESVNRAFSYLLSNKTAFGVGREVDTSDFHVEVIDLLGNKVAAEVGVAFFVAAYSILRKAPPQPALLVLGDMSVQGNIKPVRSLTEPLQVAMDNGAKRALIPIENKRQFLEVNPDVLEQVDPIFYGDLRQASFKALGLNCACQSVFSNQGGYK